MTTPSSQRSFAAKDKSEASVKLIQCSRQGNGSGLYAVAAGSRNCSLLIPLHGFPEC
jgi:hypothetical protein